MAKKSQGNRKSGAISINNLAGEIQSMMSGYTAAITEGLDKAKTKATSEGVKELKATSPGLTGEYRFGWAKKKVNSSMVIHNKTDYQLTHLLEKGHVNRDGSRSKKFVHIAPVEAHVIKNFEDEVEKVIKDAAK